MAYPQGTPEPARQRPASGPPARPMAYPQGTPEPARQRPKAKPPGARTAGGLSTP
jgi:hypothetical protein